MIDRLDPLEAAKQIEGSYKRYLKTLLALRDEQLAAAFDAEIDASTLLTKGPILEMTPPYETGATCRELITEGILHPDFARIDSKAFRIDRPLYLHQEAAVRKFTAGRNLVVSTGTGSGKTESFLIPIINALIEESSRGTLGPGVRALLLYPMNALANDQLKRLRAVLAAVPEITFGRYTGETVEHARDAEAEFAQANPGQQRLPNELLSRDEMRGAPPHLLLTNYAMLEYLLLRPVDMDLFDGAHAGTWRFIVMDEAHVYDGAQGSEVALLIRRLKQRVAPGANLQCIATSASLNGSVRNDPRSEAMEFATNLFDAKFEYADGDTAEQDLVEPVRKTHAPTPTWSLTGDQLLGLRSGALKLDDVFPSTASAAAALASERSMVELKDALSAGPVDVRTLRERLWPDDDRSAELLDALVELGSGIQDDGGHPVLSARYHLFVRATEGAYVSFNDDGPHIFLGRHEVDPQTGRAVFEFGTCTRCGAVHLAGDVEHRDRREYFVPSKAADRSVNWLVLADEQGDVLDDEDELTLADLDKAKSDPTTRRLCTGCGLIADAVATTCPGVNCGGGQMLLVREHAHATRVMSRCTECGTQSRQGVRRLRTDVNAAPAVVTTALYQQLPEATDESADQVGGGRKLLMFSDSRQAAAFAAPYLDRTYTRMLERRYITQALRDPSAAGEELPLKDLALLTRERADAAGHFPRAMGKIEISQAVNQWISGELMTLDTRQSLEGLGLMRVALRPATPIPLRGFTSLGLTDDESWALLNELVKTIRLQAAVTVLDRVDVRDERFAPRNTRVRMKSVGSDRAKQIISWSPSAASATNSRITFLRKVLADLSNDTPAERILEGSWKLLESSGLLASEAERGAGGYVYQLDHNQLGVSNGAECQWYSCDACRLLTAFSVRDICPNSRCTGRLKPFELPDPAEDTNHYRVVYQTMNTAPLTAREHTAQWSAKEAAEIQRDFISGAVNVLSCSTTFELGVDVGDLQSVVMRNMPPKTANYVQRAGRAGRRAASAALVVTYANRSAHDLAQYQNPTAMIAGQMRIPWVPVDNARIGRRHAHSIALAAYFRHCYETDGEWWKAAGPFFSPNIAGGPSPADGVREFLTPVPAHVQDALAQALPAGVQTDIGVHDGSWVAPLVELLESVQDELSQDVADIDARIEESVKARKFGVSKQLEETKRTILGRPLLGYLGSRNILPKYGFPVDTVELNTLNSTEAIGRKLALDRDLSMAIYDYAPGNQVVAGGKLWTSAGLRKRPGKELVRHKYRVCTTCGRFERGAELDPAVPCPSCMDPFKSIGTLVVPEFGFVAASDTRDVGSAPPDRRWHGGSYVETHGDEIGTYHWAGSSGLKVSARAGVRAWLAAVSDGTGEGFQLCQWCYWAAPVERGSRRRKHQRPDNGRECDGPLERISLGHRYQSDIAEFTFDGAPYLKDQEANWLSALYAILEGASYALEITRDDIDGALSWSADHRRSIVLFDTVPGGAGSAKRIAENIGLVLESTVKRVTSCDCGEETSCYGCLRSYRNGRFHESLSRRAALQILRG
ncbi:DEAD/DEAH box helicase [Mycolicibacterium mageritense DSM 44476 = CIP 104973]|uniref:DEAD/DEAH box helicase n=1 Tax=Mycolicibacterium mageritense TaxID=53462 RepID=A0ABM7HW55_MYCME|nr:DEAD/DEAH box helicase [Mycolicibacterium mageritense]MCC9184850.1 DEAD/DEAH box helicase [Mycolicibacterium mageritense]BBX34829.1 DEAD/DEAH box helicase [Mycolicibacterium mageritense]CDO20651.1 DEAD/DEAH box helicase [Mycolicibacterium mageritense DSM 44476 = CIP 104973]